MEWEDRNSALLAEKRIMAGHYQGLKSAMDGFRAVQGERLKQLSLQAQAAERELTAIIQHAERILKLAEMCRKLETEQVGPLMLLHSPVTHKHDRHHFTWHHPLIDCHIMRIHLDQDSYLA